MSLISNFIFLIIFSASLILFYRNLSKIIRNINLGKPLGQVGNKKERWKNVLLIALGQKKMFIGI